MKQYKPTYLGRLLPKKDEIQKNWLSTQYPKFEEYYNAIKEYSEEITDIIGIYSNNDFKVQLIAEQEVFDNIHKKNSKIIIEGNILSI